MADYIMPVEYKHIDNTDSMLISFLGHGILEKLNYSFSGQRLIEAKILMINEIQYMKNLNEIQVKNLISDFNAVDVDGFFNVCIQHIMQLFDVSKGKFFAMQTVRDLFKGHSFKPQMNFYSSLNNIDDKISGRPELSRVLAILIPAVSMRNMIFSRVPHKGSEPQAFYGDKAFLDVADLFGEDVINNYFI